MVAVGSGSSSGAGGSDELTNWLAGLPFDGGRIWGCFAAVLLILPLQVVVDSSLSDQKPASCMKYLTTYLHVVRYWEFCLSINRPIAFFPQVS